MEQIFNSITEMNDTNRKQAVKFQEQRRKWEKGRKFIYVKDNSLPRTMIMKEA